VVWKVVRITKIHRIFVLLVKQICLQAPEINCWKNSVFQRSQLCQDA